MRILVLGATGYVGSRLVPALLAAGHEVVAASSSPPDPDRFAWGGEVAWRQCDVTDRRGRRTGDPGRRGRLLPRAQPEPAQLRRPRPGRRDARARCRVRRPACAGSSTSRGWCPGSTAARPSRPTWPPGSRSSTLLAEADCSTLSVRAGVVIGAGSTSYEVVRQLASLLLVQPVPSWMRSSVQPVAVSDVVRALVAAFEDGAPEGDVDLGGPDVDPLPPAARGVRAGRPAAPPPRPGPGGAGERGRARGGAARGCPVPHRHRARRPACATTWSPAPTTSGRSTTSRCSASTRRSTGRSAEADPTSPRPRCRATRRGPGCEHPSSTSCTHPRSSERASASRCVRAADVRGVFRQVVGS